jgi:hypothetical protein
LTSTPDRSPRDFLSPVCRGQERLQFRDQGGQTLRAFRFTFPDNENAPPGRFQERTDFKVKIAFPVTSEFGGPPFDPGFWGTVAGAIFMAMPETTMNKHHRVSAGQHQIWVSGHVFVMGVASGNGQNSTISPWYRPEFSQTIIFEKAY